MTLSIKNPKADELARELARRQSRTITEAVIGALEAELEREKRRARRSDLAERLLEIGKSYSQLPDLDTRSDDEILGYDENGLPS
jgi:antitoxin VapB